MKSTKESVFEYVRQSIYTDRAFYQGIETRDVADGMGKQRSNISAILNELVKEGKLQKSNTRPVRYKLVEKSENKVTGAELGIFIGENGSLRNSIQLLKAAVLYPKKPLNVFFSGKSGSGITYFATLMYKYAVLKGILPKDAPYVEVNCRNYSKNVDVLDAELFGKVTPGGNCFERAKGGLLFIDCFDLLDVRQQTRIFSFLDTGVIINENGEKIDCSDVYLILSCASQNAAFLKRKIPMMIEIPELSERPLEERFLLNNKFFEEEARNLKRNIEVTSESVKALLLTEFTYNVKELKNEILTACANAYVRVAEDDKKTLRVYVSDFSPHVNRSLLRIKNHNKELEVLFGNDAHVYYDQKSGYQNRVTGKADSRISAETDVKEEEQEEKRPVLLYAMHGNGTAHSLCEVTNALTCCENAYSYDMPLESDTETAMSELRTLIRKIDRGAGVIVIYDMGSIKTMVDMISEETGIQIRCLYMPVTLVGIDTARKCSMERDVDTVYHMLNQELREQWYQYSLKNSVIITLCHTGEGGAVYLKNYIEQYSRLGFQIIPMEFSDRKALLKEVMNLKRTYNIHSFIGTYDPKLLGIPFLSIKQILDAPTENVDKVLMFEPINVVHMDYSRVYEHLEEQLHYTSIAKLKSVLPQVVDELAITYSLDQERTLGLFVHLACAVERILSGGIILKNAEARKLIPKLDDDYRAISKIVKRLEKTFKIIIDDNEIAMLIMILKKI